MDNSLAEILGKLVALESKVEKLSIDSNSQQRKTNYGFPKPPNKENGVASKSRQRRTKKTDRTTNTKEPVVVQKSNNPDFAIATKGIYKHVQLAKAQLNWGRGVPKAIVKQVESAFAFISLPMADDELSAKFKQLIDSTLNSIAEISNCHLEKKQDQVSNLLSHCKPEDKNRAAAVAAKYIGKQFRTKPEKEFLDSATAKAVSAIGTKINVPLSPALDSDMDTGTAKQPTEKSEVNTLQAENSTPESKKDKVANPVHNSTFTVPSSGSDTKSPVCKVKRYFKRVKKLDLSFRPAFMAIEERVENHAADEVKCDSDIKELQHKLSSANRELKVMERKKQTKTDAYAKEQTHIAWLDSSIKRLKKDLQTAANKRAACSKELADFKEKNGTFRYEQTTSDDPLACSGPSDSETNA